MAYTMSLLLCLLVMALAIAVIMRSDETRQPGPRRAGRPPEGPGRWSTWEVAGRSIDSGLERRLEVAAISPMRAVQKAQQWGVRVESVRPAAFTVGRS